MAQSGALLVPTLNGEIYGHKPPLLFWSMLAASRLWGALDETAVRIPVAVSACLVLPLVYLMGRWLFSRRAGWIAAAALGTSINVMLQARAAQIDMLLALWVTLAMTCFVRGLVTHRRGWYLGFFAAAGVATLAKGPVGLVPPLLSIVAFLLWSGERDELRRLRLIPGLALYAAIVLAWLIPAGLSAGESYLREIVFRQNLTRYADPWGHIEPWYYYLTVLPVNFAPAFLLLPSSIAYAARRLEGRARQGFRFALCWAAVTLVFFSATPGKRGVYLLTMYPALALLIGAALDRLSREAAPRRRWLLAPLGLIAAIAAAAAAVLPAAIRSRPALEVLGPGFARHGVATLGLLALGAALGCAFAWRRRVLAAFCSLAAGSGIAALAGVLLLLPPFDALNSARELSAQLVQRANPSEPYAIYPRIEPGFLFYTARFAVLPRGEQELREFAARPGRVWLLAKRHALARLDPPLPLTEVARDRDLDQGYILLTTPTEPGGE